MNNETIITFDILDNKIRKLITDQEELALIEKAYHFACEKHEGRKRINGDDYILHPLHVANILVDLNVDAETIIAALIHETLNHGTATNKEIADIFGEDMSLIVQSISRINKLELANNKESSAIYLRKVLVGMAEDVRVLIVKLADRLHN
ncbi:MAG TPA: HD domain-containing protein, partial [Bacilli bacterium]|nr:HD domain-containing protein [Bacilli bacterium]